MLSLKDGSLLKVVGENGVMLIWGQEVNWPPGAHFQQEEYYIFFTRPNMEINTKMHWLELSTMIHVVRKQIKYILVNERPRDISRARLHDL